MAVLPPSNGTRTWHQFSTGSLLLLMLAASIFCAWLIPTLHVAHHVAGSICVTVFILVAARDRSRVRGMGILRGSAFAGAMGGMVGGGFWVVFTSAALLSTEYNAYSLLANLPYRLFVWISAGGLVGMATGCLLAARRFQRPLRDEQIGSPPIETPRITHSENDEAIEASPTVRSWLDRRWQEAPAWVSSIVMHSLLLHFAAPMASDWGYRPAGSDVSRSNDIEVVHTDVVGEHREGSSAPFNADEAFTIAKVVDNEFQQGLVGEELPPDLDSDDSSSSQAQAAKEDGSGDAPADEGNLVLKAVSQDEQKQNIGTHLFGRGGQATSLVELNVAFQATKVAFSPNSRRLAVGGYSDSQTSPSRGEVAICNLIDGTKHNLPEHVETASRVAFSPDGTTLAVTTAHFKGGKEGKELGGVWNVESGRRIRPLIRPDGFWSCNFGLRANYSPDGKQMVMGYTDRLQLCDAASGAIVHTRSDGDPALICEVEFSPDGSQVLVAYRRSVHLVDVKTWEIIRTFKAAWLARFSPDGKTILTTTSNRYQDFSLLMWDVESGKLLNTLKGHTENVYDCAFSSDGQNIASGGTDQTVRIWDVGSGGLLHTLTEHSDTVLGVAFAPDGSTLATASRERVLLWNSHKLPDPSNNAARAEDPVSR